MTSTPLRDLIDIPERAGTDDYVLRLTEGVEADHLAATISEYVLTDELVDAFDRALALIEAGLRDGQSKAAFLAGSFGSGKSHFMAVLYALLGRNAQARAVPALAPTIAAHDAVLTQRTILRLAFHFLDAASMEATIFGGYLRQIRELHPDCELPAVHRSDALLTDADALRASFGDDEKFFGTLNSGSGTADVWSGVLDGQWDAASYDAARHAPPSAGDRQRLVSDLVAVHFRAFQTSEEFVSLDEGLAAISRHAQGLGYDAITLFCDELVLWLAFKVRDNAFFSREVQKLTKLVEYQHARAIPFISIVARQLDLAQYFLDSGGMGAEQEALNTAFGHQEGRFTTITLGDENLPYVAQQRLLAPVNDAARAQLDAAFDALDRRPEVWDVLLDGVNTDARHLGSDQDAFRRTYPFSPALISTLRTLASAMQRDRTALKVMQQLLVQQRDTLTVDSVVPAGDVFDLVVEGNNAVSEEMRGTFNNARTLYVTKVRPLLLGEHGLAEPDVAGLPADHPFHADDRLVKTLLLSAVADTVPALRGLTAGRLAALNHGSIVTRLPGQEADQVLRRVRRWQAAVPEIHLTDDPRDPIISLRLSPVDYQRLIDGARSEDSEGARRLLIKEIAFESLGIVEREDIDHLTRRQIVWRGSSRVVEIQFGNIRDTSYLPDDAFRAGRDTWRFVIDYPFDVAEHSSREDLQRLEDLGARFTERTVAWVPHFLSASRQRDLGQLVILNYLLASEERWTERANVLAEGERESARSILKQQQGALRSQLRRSVQEAYGAASVTPGNLDRDEGHERVLISLSPEFMPQAPVGHDLAAAFGNLVDQALSATFPAHPQFEPADRAVRPAELATVLEAVEAARAEQDGRVVIADRARRLTLQRVANPVQVGYMGENAFVFDADRFLWDRVFTLGTGQAGIAPADPVSVGQARGWIDAQEPRRGLRSEVSDLIVCAWAVLHNRTWFRYGAPLVPGPVPGRLTPEMELRPEPLPTSDDWQRACARSAALFGWPDARRYLTGQAVGELAQYVAQQATGLASDAADLSEHLAQAYRRLGLDPLAETGRLATARAAQRLLSGIRDAGTDRVAALGIVARAELPTTDTAAAKSLASAAPVAGALTGFAWDRLDPLRAGSTGTGTRARQASTLLENARTGLHADELAQPLADVLRAAEQGAFGWLQQAAERAQPAPASAETQAPLIATTAVVHDEATLTAAMEEVRAFLADQVGAPIEIEWRRQQ